MALLINAQGVCKSYGKDTLFSNISLGVFEKDRLGIIGPNGSGKSTLLKIFMGIETPDDGKIVRNSGTHLVYLPQEDSFNPEKTIKSVLFDSFENELDEGEYQHLIWEVTGEKIFSDLMKKVGTLSGGWRKRLAIVKALLKKPDLLLMDEPTNHLDLEGIIWLENILKKSCFSFVLVTHDRLFLENTVNSIVELNKIYPDGYFKTTGNYSDFITRREEFITAQIQKEQILSNKLRREEEWLQRMPKARATKAQYRIDQAAQLKLDLRKISDSNSKNKAAVIDFETTDRKTNILLETHHLAISRNGRLLVEDLNLKLSPGVCLGLLGKNGSGKSTLINLLNGSILPDAGSIKYVDNLRIVTFDQKREQLDQSQTLMNALSPTGDHVFYKGSSIHVVAWAKRFLFSSDQLRQTVSSLSGGEQARVLIANLMLRPADILLLDEPTNDLDIPTLEVLENSLSEFPGAIVLITHDRFLLDRLSDRILYLAGNGKTEFFADYNQCCKAIETEASAEGSINRSVKIKKSKTINPNEQRELSKIPGKIQKAEAKVKSLEQQLEEPGIQSDADCLTKLCEEIEIEKCKISQLYKRWEELD